MCVCVCVCVCVSESVSGLWSSRVEELDRTSHVHNTNKDGVDGQLQTKRWSAKKYSSSFSTMSLSSASKEEKRELKRNAKKQQASPCVDESQKLHSNKQGSRRATSLLNLFTSSSSPNAQGRSRSNTLATYGFRARK